MLYDAIISKSGENRKTISDFIILLIIFLYTLHSVAHVKLNNILCEITMEQ